MKFYIDKSGVIRWSPAGWPDMPLHDLGPSPDSSDYSIADDAEDRYEQALSRAKAESVPVRDRDNVALAIFWVNPQALSLNNDTFYEVPDSEINKEWL